MSFLNLQYFKERLLKERERILKNMEEIDADLARIVAEDEINDMEDLAQLETENERDKAILKSLKEELKEIDEALKRINEGTYGIDRESGKPLPLLKLLVNPLFGKA